MQVYKILTPFSYSQTHCVVADDMAEAEKLFSEKYPYTKILKIELFSQKRALLSSILLH